MSLTTHMWNRPSRAAFPSLTPPLRVVVLCCVATLLVVPARRASAQEESVGDPRDIARLEAMSLDEILEVKVDVPSALTPMRRPEAPSSITVITAEQIAHTPARNLYDLLEVYVPGALWLNSELGPQLAMRGTSGRNYRYLLMVNGRVLNSKAHFGAVTELEQWDLRDIQRIEVIRGPGSVTHGAGAVTGVISITTHDASSRSGQGVSGGHVYPFRSTGAAAWMGHLGHGYSISGHASVTQTAGTDANHFLVTKDNQAGYAGREIEGKPLDYFEDYQDRPQAKLHLDGTFGENLRAWFRYTQDGSTWKANELKTSFDGDLQSQQGVRHRQAVLVVQFDRTLKPGLDLSVTLSGASLDAERRQSEVRHPTPSHPLNKIVDFSETDLALRTCLNWAFSGWGELAVGAEYALDYYGPGWFNDADELRLGEGGIIVSGSDSKAIDPDSQGSADRRDTALFVGKGWFANTGSLFSELNLAPTRWLKVLVSGRFDKNQYSDALISPRGAAVFEPARGHFLKLIGQRSVRMNTASMLYYGHKTDGHDETSERLDSAEVVYEALPFDNALFVVSSFFNRVSIVDWDSARNLTVPVGELKLWGLELESSYGNAKKRVSGSYSFVDQLDWQLASGVNGSGISYADYRVPLEDLGTTIRGVGNDLSNWPRHALKLQGMMELWPRLTLEADTRVFWDFAGQENGLTALERAVEGTSEEAAVAASIDSLKQHDVYAADMRLNASLAYELREGFVVRIFSQNIVGLHNAKRYARDGGYDEPAPHKVRFVEEPRTFGATLTYSM